MSHDKEFATLNSMPHTSTKPHDNYLPKTYGRQEYYRNLSTCDQMRIRLVDFLPSQPRMRQILITMVKIEIFFDVYLLVCTLTSKYKSLDCAAHPQKSNEIYLIFVILPFFVLKLLAFNCCTSPQSVIV
jgi:hypothetical protein